MLIESFVDHNPLLLASGRNVFVSAPQQPLTTSYAMDLFETTEALTIIQQVFQKIVSDNSPGNETLVYALQNWLLKSKTLQPSPLSELLWGAASDALTLCTIRKAMQSHWLNVPAAMQNISKVEAVHRFKGQLLKAFSNASNNTQYPVLSGFSTKASSCNNASSLSVPWMEWTPNICIIYIPTVRVLEIDVTINCINVLPQTLCNLHGIEIDPTYPCFDAHSNNGAHSAIFAQCMALLLLGDEMQMSDAIDHINMKLSVMIKAKSTSDFFNQKEYDWHHIDIDDPSDIHTLKLLSPRTCNIISPLESILSACRDYMTLYKKIKSIAGMSATANTQTISSNSRDTWRK